MSLRSPPLRDALTSPSGKAKKKLLIKVANDPERGVVLDPEKA